MRKSFCLLALLAPIHAFASCGAAFCTINTSWDVQGAWMEPGIRADLRYEYIKQDQPLAGTEEVAVGEIPGHHDEISTVNRNWLASIAYTLNQDWSFSVLLPVVDRKHRHIHNHMGAALLDSWEFSELGDVRVTARRRLATFEDARPSLSTVSLDMGLKLPTGDTDVENDEGLAAERSLQPGSGTTDLLAGLAYSRLLPLKGLSWFVHGELQVPLDYADGYKSGRRVAADAGLRYAANDRLSWLLQLNALHRARDSGPQAEPENSGGRFLFIAPGVSYAFSPAFQLYAFVQLPVYQKVKGVQLVADYATVIGVSTRF